MSSKQKKRKFKPRINLIEPQHIYQFVWNMLINVILMIVVLVLVVVTMISWHIWYDNDDNDDNNNFLCLEYFNIGIFNL